MNEGLRRIWISNAMRCKSKEDILFDKARFHIISCQYAGVRDVHYVLANEYRFNR